jgi:hypothetical protein
MKQTRIVSLMLALALLLTGCASAAPAAGSGDASAEGSTGTAATTDLPETGNEEASQIDQPASASPAEGKTIEATSQQAPGAFVKLTLPSGWDGEVETAEGEEESGFGLRFWPEDEPELQVTVLCYLDGFGMCGTGVDIQTILLKDGLEATTYTERIDLYYFTLCYHVPGYYVASYVGDETLWKTDEDQVLSILATLQTRPSTMTEEEATSAVAEALGEGEWTAHYNVRDDSWTAYCFVSDGGQLRTALVDSTGAVREN